MTLMSIHSHWLNTIQAFCEKNEENEKFCKWLRYIVELNFENVQKLSKQQHLTDRYHHQIFLFYQQILGIADGFKEGVKRSRLDHDIPFVDFLLLNSRFDIEDLKVYYNKFSADHEHQRWK